MPDEEPVDADFKDILAEGPDTQPPTEQADPVGDWLGTPYWVLFQFESPDSVRFGIKTSDPKPSNEVLIAVLSRIVRELETIHKLEIEDTRNAAIAQAIEDSTELVDANGLPVVAPNREQRRHPEAFGLIRRPKNGV